FAYLGVQFTLQLVELDICLLHGLLQRLLLLHYARSFSLWQQRGLISGFVSKSATYWGLLPSLLRCICLLFCVPKLANQALAFAHMGAYRHLRWLNACV